MTLRVVAWLAASVLSASALLAPGGTAGTGTPGRLETGQAPSPVLGQPIDYQVYLPPGYESGTGRYPVLYLLHGRGNTMRAWARAKDTLDSLIRSGRIPPLLAIAPDAPWSQRASWYVDSTYRGPDPGRPVETALTRDLVRHVDHTYRTAADRGSRLVGGYSMGGAGALRLALAHPQLFGGALVLSPAVYTPQPPPDSSVRDYGAFGRGTRLFDARVYQALNYPAALYRQRARLPVRLFVAVGDDEWPNPDPAQARHDLDFEAAALYNAARRTPGVRAEFRVLDGGHDWAVWLPALAEGLPKLFGPPRARAAHG